MGVGMYPEETPCIRTPSERPQGKPEEEGGSSLLCLARESERERVGEREESSR